MLDRYNPKLGKNFINYMLEGLTQEDGLCLLKLLVFHPKCLLFYLKF